VVDILRALQNKGHEVDIHDPYARPEDVQHEYGISILSNLPASPVYDGVAVLVSHDLYKDLPPESVRGMLKRGGLVYDMKGLWRHVAGELGCHFLYKTL
jgi:UDP-N-acetyl-D-galactosamine dehydrogenase